MPFCSYLGKARWIDWSKSITNESRIKRAAAKAGPVSDHLKGSPHSERKGQLPLSAVLCVLVPAPCLRHSPDGGRCHGDCAGADGRRNRCVGSAGGGHGFPSAVSSLLVSVCRPPGAHCRLLESFRPLTVLTGIAVCPVFAAATVYLQH